ncbi:MAG: hypothetical protein ACREIP_19785, partial [Alphaproteobacteria bacterium]
MYSAATQRALSGLLAPYGIRYGSLTWPLYSMHVQEVLWARYPDLCDLQYSCWRVGPGEASCSQCSQCLRIAMTALAAGHDPQRMGIDLEKLMAFSADWEPAAASALTADMLPREWVRRRFDALILDVILRTSPLHLAMVLAQGSARRLIARPTLAAVGALRRLRKR